MIQLPFASISKALRRRRRAGSLPSGEFGVPDGLIQRALRERVARALPLPGGWLRLLRLIDAARGREATRDVSLDALAWARLAARGRGVTRGVSLDALAWARHAARRRDHAGFYPVPAVLTIRLELDAFALTWRLPCGGSLATCPLS